MARTLIFAQVSKTPRFRINILGLSSRLKWMVLIDGLSGYWYTYISKLQILFHPNCTLLYTWSIPIVSHWSRIWDKKLERMNFTTLFSTSMIDHHTRNDYSCLWKIPSMYFRWHNQFKSDPHDSCSWGEAEGEGEAWQDGALYIPSDNREFEKIKTENSQKVRHPPHHTTSPSIIEGRVEEDNNNNNNNDKSKQNSMQEAPEKLGARSPCSCCCFILNSQPLQAPWWWRF